MRARKNYRLLYVRGLKVCLTRERRRYELVVWDLNTLWLSIQEIDLVDRRYYLMDSAGTGVVTDLCVIPVKSQTIAIGAINYICIAMCRPDSSALCRMVCTIWLVERSISNVIYSAWHVRLKWR